MVRRSAYHDCRRVSMGTIPRARRTIRQSGRLAKRRLRLATPEKRGNHLANQRRTIEEGDTTPAGRRCGNCGHDEFSHCVTTPRLCSHTEEQYCPCEEFRPHGPSDDAPDELEGLAILAGLILRDLNDAKSLFEVDNQSSLTYIEQAIQTAQLIQRLSKGLIK